MFLAQILRTWNVSGFDDVGYTVMLTLGVALILLGLAIIAVHYFQRKRGFSFSQIVMIPENIVSSDIVENKITTEHQEVAITTQNINKTIDIYATVPEITNVAKKTPKKYNASYKRKNAVNKK